MSSENTSTSSTELTGYQRRYLRGLANPLNPLVQVGESGLSDAVIKSLDDSLEHHDLVKIRLHQPEDKKASAEELASRSAAELCGLIGYTRPVKSRVDRWFGCMLAVNESN
jgi:RNA-binding protein